MPLGLSLPIVNCYAPPAVEDPDGSISPCRRLSQLTKKGDAKVMQAEIHKMQARHGRERVAANMMTSDFGERGSMSALHHAASGGRAEILKLCILAGANVETMDDAGNGPLHLAAKGGHARAVYVLVQAGAQVARGNNFGSTPLMKAETCEWDVPFVKEGKAIVRKILEEGIQGITYNQLPPEEPPPATSTPKSPVAVGPPKTPAVGFWAILNRTNTDDQVRVDSRGLVDHGATSEEADADSGCFGWRPRAGTWKFEPAEDPEVELQDENAAGLGSREPIAELVKRADLAAVQARLTEVFERGGREAAILEVSNCEEDDQDSRIVFSALHVAAMRGDAKILRVLLATKADPNLTTDAGDTPLHFATRAGHQDCVAELLGAGARSTIVNNFGRPSLSKVHT